jgi:Tol biopolymer transport system component
LCATARCRAQKPDPEHTTLDDMGCLPFDTALILLGLAITVDCGRLSRPEKAMQNFEPIVADPASDTGSENSAERRRLDSWKDIAVYLGRGVRTVQCWEADEHLPVHRLKHKANYTVYAWTDEMDAWLLARSKAAAVVPAAESGEEPGLEDSASAASPRAPWFSFRMLWVAVCCGVAATAGLGYLLLSVSDEAGVEPLVSQPFTSAPALEAAARIAPDGRQVVFVQAVEPDNPDIVLKLSEAGSVVPLSATHAAEFSPAWSPDSSEVAFLRDTGQRDLQFLMIVSTSSGTERTVSPVHAPAFEAGKLSPTEIDWSPDGRFLIVSDSLDDGPYSIVAVNVETGEKTHLTHPPISSYGDIGARVSPSGDQLAVTWVSGEGRSEIVIYGVSGDWSSVAETGRLTAKNSAWNAFPVWTPDGQAILFSAGVTSRTSIWTARLNALDDTHRIQTGIEAATVEDVRETQDGAWRMVYRLAASDLDIIRIPLTERGGHPMEDEGSDREAIATTTYREREPRLSPDGTMLAYVSDRSGSEQIWVKDLSGGDPRRLTDFEDCVIGSPRWSLDGTSILFHAVRNQGARVYSVRMEDGEVVAPIEGDEQFAPEWSRDGRWLYFTSSQLERARRAAFRVSADGGAPEFLGVQPAQAIADGPHGAHLIVHHGLRLQSPADSVPTLIASADLLGYQSFDAKEDGVYYVSDSAVWFWSFSEAESFVVASYKGVPGPGLSVSDDATAAYVVAAAVERADIMVVEDVRVNLPHDTRSLFAGL